MATTTRATPPPTVTTTALNIANNTSGALRSPTSPSAAAAAALSLPTIREDSVLPSASSALQHSSALTSTAFTSPKAADKQAFSPRRSPAFLTGAAAMADAKRKRQPDRASRETTPNPAVAAMQSLMGGGGMSRSSDAPAPDKLSEPLRQAAEEIQIPEEGSTTSAQTSPVSLSSFGGMDGSNGHSGAMTATTGTDSAESQFVAEPAEMMGNDGAPDDGDANKAFSYPGLPTQQTTDGREPARGMSLPGFQDGSKASPAGKRHKCPYCATDFTRHHNLKSHLLTHSQEKPFVCSTCQARFRRLHDLKRHTKLHTGERPHTCDKCGRRFARGDALARHNKGPGGCAGRRSSFGGDDDMGDGMDGVEYTNGEDDEGDTSTTDLSRRVSEPSRKRVAVEAPHDSGRTLYRQQSSTYPPIQHRQGDMGPPAAVSAGSNNNNPSSPRNGHPQPPALNTSYFPNFQHGSGSLIESPKPLSPGQPPDQHRLSVDQGTGSYGGRNRSPSLTTQFQQTHFGRGSIGGRTPPANPPSQFTSGLGGQPGPTQLPPLTLSTSAANRPSLAGPSILHHQQMPSSGSNPASASSHGQSSGSSMRDILGAPNPGGSESELWSHLRQLEGKFVRMQDEYELRISRLQEEVITLRSQLGTSQQGGPAGSYPSDARY